MSYCDTCGHQFSDICGTCESLDGVPVQYSPKPSDVRPIKDDEIIGTFDYATGNFTPTRKETNADRIRHMTDEGLAEFLRSFAIIHMKSLCEYVGINYVDDDNDTDEKEEAIKSVLGWLKEED